MFDEVRVLSTTELVFSSDVRKACIQNLCGRYNTNWSCPPACGSIEELKAIIQSYQHILIVTKIYQLQDPFDLETMEEGRKEITSLLRKLNKKYQLTKNNMMILGVGSCDLCSPCLYPSKACSYPEERIIALEGAGIDCLALAKSANIKYYNGQNTLTYFAAILYNEE